MAQKDLNLRQRRWLELIKDYELVIDYHPGKANICEAQKFDNELQAKRAQCESTSDSEFLIRTDDCLMFRDRIYVPRNSELIRKILNKAYSSCLSVHPGSTKMYNDLKQLYLWHGMKRDISKFQVKAKHQVPSCLLQPIMIPNVPIPIILDRDSRFTSRFWKKLQEALGTKLYFSTAFHPQTDGQSERVIQILEDMLHCCILEFEGSWEKYLPLIEFAYNNSFQSSIKMAPYEALYGRKCRTPLYWTELSENKIHGVDLIRETEEKVKVICDSLKAASDRQKSYVDLKQKNIEFQIRDKVFLKVSLWKKILRFGWKGKLSPQFIRPYEITERVGPVAYQLSLSSELEKIHNVFHVSMLQRYRFDPSHVISPTEVEIQSDMSYAEEAIRILAREIKKLKNKKIALVKVLWHRHMVEEATWEPEDAVRKQYPNLFTVIA
ncbi:reverse transcriptase [Gossypium australe]|uniref:Reverse transcriptase n=1 Tax=Gossypium australe TaxID=47621 RepID=A0A5B6UUC0_9ROSI|nr:reverse transcriptase [Gossypium australe]